MDKINKTATYEDVSDLVINEVSPYPLLFNTIFKTKTWGGRKISNWVKSPMPDGKIGEAWLLSDRNDAQSIVQNGSLKGKSLGEIIKNFPKLILGKFSEEFKQFPLLIKILDVKKNLSLQIHPSEKNIALIPNGENAKTEGWVILEAKAKSKIFAGLNPNINDNNLRNINKKNIDKFVPSFKAKPDQAIFLNSGTIHSAQNNITMLEIQQNSDVTFRLFDWGRIDIETNKPRPLQIENAIKCIDFEQGKIAPIKPKIEVVFPILREQIFNCPFFIVWRIKASHIFKIGEVDAPTIIFCLKGKGTIKYRNIDQKVQKGNLILLPSSLGISTFNPKGSATIIIIKIPVN